MKNITYEQFVALCNEVYKDEFEGQGSVQLSYYDRTYRYNQNNNPIKDNPRLIVEWSTGGVAGGSCWDSSDPQPYTSHDAPQDLQILDVILEKICPILSFLQYKNLYNTLVKYDTRTENEYYGNSTDYSVKMVYLKDLYAYLVEHKIINNEKA